MNNKSVRNKGIHTRKESKVASEEFFLLLTHAIKLAGSVKALSNHISVRTITIYSWQNGLRNPSKSSIEILRSFVASRSFYEQAVSKNEDEAFLSDIFLSVEEKKGFIHSCNPVLYRSVALFDDSLERTDRSYAFRTDWLCSYIRGGESLELFMYEQKGRAMEPILQEGAIVLVNASDKELVDGKIYLISFNNATYIRRFADTPTQQLFRVDDRKYDFQDIKIENNASNFFIVGRIIWTAFSL
ncbi:MAG: S24 family peptidase [Desulfovibrionaceae bacterium]